MVPHRAYSPSPAPGYGRSGIPARRATRRRRRATGRRDGVRVTPRRLVVTVCPREPGVVTLPIARGRRAEKLNATAIAHQLRQIVAERGLADACACARVRRRLLEARAQRVGRDLPDDSPGRAREDHVAVGWKTCAYSLGTLDCLAAVLDDNLGRAPGGEPGQSQPERLKR